MEVITIEDKPKQVIILRHDLKMRLGKAVAQGCHASNEIIIKNLYAMNQELLTNLAIVTPNLKILNEWLFNGKNTKVCVRVNSEQELKDIYQKALDANLLCSIITDSGLTEFHGIPTLTCAAIGPAKSSIIDQITGGLKLL